MNMMFNHMCSSNSLIMTEASRKPLIYWCPRITKFVWSITYESAWGGHSRMSTNLISHLLYTFYNLFFIFFLFFWNSIESLVTLPLSHANIMLYFKSFFYLCKLNFVTQIGTRIVSLILMVYCIIGMS